VIEQKTKWRHGFEDYAAESELSFAPASAPGECRAISHYRAQHRTKSAVPNGGGVAISGLEMRQNSIRQTWIVDELEARLRAIMRSIHNRCIEHGRLYRSR
jgi:glutamate dehydrogenase/leucine dehydrogenase